MWEFSWFCAWTKKTAIWVWENIEKFRGVAWKYSTLAAPCTPEDVRALGGAQCSRITAAAALYEFQRIPIDNRLSGANRPSRLEIEEIYFELRIIKVHTGWPHSHENLSLTLKLKLWLSNAAIIIIQWNIFHYHRSFRIPLPHLIQAYSCNDTAPAKHFQWC